MQETKRKQVSRRNFVKWGAGAAMVAPFFNFPERALATQKSLSIAKWTHFVPEYDDWFAAMAQDWGRQHDIRVRVDNFPVELTWSRASAEVRDQRGHDIFVFPWPPAEFQKHTIDHTEIYETAAFKYGSIPQISYKSTFQPASKRHFAFADYWIPSPLHYFSDFWAEANMPLGPVHYGSLRSGGQRVRAKLGVPCGLSLSPTLEGNISLHTLLYAFRGRILGDSGEVAINSTAFTIEALKYARALNHDAGTPDELTWRPAGNVQAMLARKTSCTANAISLLRAAEKQDPETATKIRLQPPLLGPYGVTAFPHATNCSVIWNFAQNQQAAKQFLADLVDNSRTSYEKSLGCNLPAYPKTIPNLIVRLENDSQGQPANKYLSLKDALHWTPNLGAPGFATPVWMETFNSSVLPKMFSSCIRRELSPEDAARAAEAEIKRIAEKWKNA